MDEDEDVRVLCLLFPECHGMSIRFTVRGDEE